MRQVKIRMRLTLVLLLFILTSITFFNQKSLAQCIVLSNNGYQVEVNLEPVTLLVPSNCPWGYNYNVAINYTINIVGQNAPASLYTLQGNLRCGTNQLFFNLPNSGGSGQTITVSNPWNGNSDCATATLNSLDCHDFELQIQGPGLSWQTINCNASPLPIELIAFQAIESNNAVQFKWTTASETNNDYFSVERSSNGHNWNTVVQAAGAGNSSSTIHYEAVDLEPLSGVSYYRLKQTDFNGDFSYSEIKAVSRSTKTAQKLHVFPNPTHGEVTVAAGESKNTTIGVFDLLGNDLTRRTPVGKQEGGDHHLDLSGLPSGAYIVRANGGTVRVFRH